MESETLLEKVRSYCGAFGLSYGPVVPPNSCPRAKSHKGPQSRLCIYKHHTCVCKEYRSSLLLSVRQGATYHPLATYGQRCDQCSNRFSPGSAQPLAARTCTCHNLQGKQKHQEGDIDGAEEQYRGVLAVDSDNADAHHLLGALLVIKHGDTEVCHSVSQPPGHAIGPRIKIAQCSPVHVRRPVPTRRCPFALSQMRLAPRHSCDSDTNRQVTDHTALPLCSSQKPSVT